MKKYFRVFLVLLLSISLYACGSQKEISYKDGDYEGVSSKDEWGGSLKLNITVTDGKIVKVDMQNLTGEGKEKDEDYGKQDGEIKNEGLYKTAQNAVEYSKEYPKKLIETQNVEEIDAISGATETYKLFKEAVSDALEGTEQ